jgi:hypothetical protein
MAAGVGDLDKQPVRFQVAHDPTDLARAVARLERDEGEGREDVVPVVIAVITQRQRDEEVGGS